jgi:O-antigen/teichoic acid export membrane protein
MGTAPTIRGKKRDAAILRGVVASVAVRVSNAAVAIVTLGFAARALTTEEFGLVAALFSLWMVLTAFDLGVGGALVTRVASSHARGDLNEMRTCVREALVALTVIGLLIGAVGTVSAFLLPWEEWVGGDTLATATVRPSVILVFVLAGAALPAAIGIITWTGQQRLASAQLAMALRGVFTLVATAAAGYAGLGPWAFILAFVGAPTLMSSALTAWVLFGELGGVVERAGLVARRIVSTIRDSAYYAICNIGNAVAFATGTLIVAAVLGPGEAALFSVASRMFAMVGTLVISSGAQLWPAMTEAITRGDIKWARSRYRRGIVAVGLVTSTVCLGLIVLGQPLARVWVGPALVPSFDLLVWTAAFTVASTVASQACVLLRAVDRMKALAALCVANAVASVVVSVLLTRVIGMSGAAVGALIGCLVVLLPGVAVLAHRILKSLGDN